MSKERRLELINNIQEQRHSTVVVYVLSDRRNSQGRINADAVREIYGMLRELKPLEKKTLDLFLCGCGGDNAVPWQMVSMFREMFDLLTVLVPYKAHSAATMIALGADTIIMGEKGQLSPTTCTTLLLRT
jgi:ClpP class serine protease